MEVILNIYNDSKNLYQDEALSKDLSLIISSLIPHLNTDLIGFYTKNNENRIDSLIENYQYSSFGDRGFSKILFLFCAESIPDEIKK
jgi:hypothetical protein